MGIMDKANEMKDKAMQSGQADEAVDQAAEKAKGATGDKYDDKIDQGDQMAKDAMKKKPAE
jgi:hypothetical protein